MELVNSKWVKKTLVLVKEVPIASKITETIWDIILSSDTVMGV